MHTWSARVGHSSTRSTCHHPARRHGGRRREGAAGHGCSEAARTERGAISRSWSVGGGNHSQPLTRGLTRARGPTRLCCTRDERKVPTCPERQVGGRGKVSTRADGARSHQMVTRIPCVSTSIERSWGGMVSSRARGPQKRVVGNEGVDPVPLQAIDDHGGRESTQQGVTSGRDDCHNKDAGVETRATAQSAGADLADGGHTGRGHERAAIGRREPDVVAGQLQSHPRQSFDRERRRNV